MPADPKWLTDARAAGIVTERRVNMPVLLAGIDETWEPGPEAEFQRQVIDLAHSLGYIVAHFRAVCIQRADGGSHYATPVQADGVGFPDLLMIRDDPPRIVVAELKAGRNRTSEEQDVWLSRFRAVGVKAFVWYPKDWKRIEATLREK